jgi:hypothetical protein
MATAEAQGLEELGIVLPELTKEEQRRVKISDLLEMHEFGAHEVSMGNRLAVPIAQDTLQAALATAGNEDRAKILQWRQRG